MIAAARAAGVGRPTRADGSASVARSNHEVIITEPQHCFACPPIRQPSSVAPQSDRDAHHSSDAKYPLRSHSTLCRGGGREGNEAPAEHARRSKFRSSTAANHSSPQQGKGRHAHLISLVAGPAFLADVLADPEQDRKPLRRREERTQRISSCAARGPEPPGGRERRRLRPGIIQPTESKKAAQRAAPPSRAPRRRGARRPAAPPPPAASAPPRAPAPPCCAQRGGRRRRDRGLIIGEPRDRSRRRGRGAVERGARVTEAGPPRLAPRMSSSLGLLPSTLAGETGVGLRSPAAARRARS